MSRVQLALNVTNIEESVAFYTALFGTEPHKRRTGYANFEIAEPALKLVLIERADGSTQSGVGGALNHLGIEVETTAEVHAAIAKSTEAGLKCAPELDTNCCFAVQDKVWLSDPSGIPWEVYTITDDNPVSAIDASMNDGRCCLPDLVSIDLSDGSAVEVNAPSCC